MNAVFLDRVSGSCSTCEIHGVTVKPHEHHLTWKSYWTPRYVKNLNNNYITITRDQTTQKKDNRSNNDLQNIHIKLKIE